MEAKRLVYTFQGDVLADGVAISASTTPEQTTR